MVEPDSGVNFVTPSDDGYRHSKRNVHILTACHNRVALTIRALEAALEAAQNAGVQASITLVDDGSTDGTAEAVSILFGSNINIITGDGSLFWAKSMQLAERQVLNSANIEDDYLLWLNDDTFLDATSIQSLLSTSYVHGDALIIGNIIDPETNDISYGGYSRSGIHPLRYSRVIPNKSPQQVDFFNGNCVLVPVRIARRIGGIDGGYSHGFADIDYSVRCALSDVSVVITPWYVGQCARGDRPQFGTIVQQWSAFTGVKGGGHLNSLSRILRLAAPRTWPLYLLITYLMWWFRAISTCVKTKI